MPNSIDHKKRGGGWIQSICYSLKSYPREVTLQIMGTIARSVLQRGTCHKSNRKEGNGQQGLWPKNRAGKEIFKTSTTNNPN